MFDTSTSEQAVWTAPSVRYVRLSEGRRAPPSPVCPGWMTMFRVRVSTALAARTIDKGWKSTRLPLPANDAENDELQKVVALSVVDR